MQFYYFDSPHKQITEAFTARVTKVHDGDTITVDWHERDFVFPIRFADTAAPELSEPGGHEAQAWLENIILGEEVNVIPHPNRVEKWGRLLAYVAHRGMDVGQSEVNIGFAKRWNDRHNGKIIDPIRKPKEDK